MEPESRYLVGIDLGTTNCALAYVDASLPEGERRVEAFDVPQLIAPGEIESLPALPSFVYLPEAHEVRRELLSLPWCPEGRDIAVGALARDTAAVSPGKVVCSAKSWLCYEGLDRRSAILPWDRHPLPRRMSPVDASRLYLEHLRDAWNFVMAQDNDELRLEKQETVLTVPASFDAVARELTVEAAQQAGLNVRLLEEPQAAFYSWLHSSGDSWRDAVAAGDTILVCDIGGGTTDFSLIAVTDQEGSVELERVAVGQHILLGGDNMDLTLAYGMAEKLRSERGLRLDPYQLAALTHACRAAKEKLGEGDAHEPQPLTILGRGTGVIGGTITTEITAEEMASLLVDGFFPLCSVEDAPAETRRMGLRALGLDYAADPAVTKHLAAFLSRHSFRNAEGIPLLPAAVLFNGGVTKSTVLRGRVAQVLDAWNAEGGGRDSRVLPTASPDLAVASGAAWYGNVRRCGGVRIKSGSARSCYIGIESSLPAVPGYAPPVEALCVVSFGLEEGSSVRVPAEGIGLLVGEPTEFRFFSSTSRQDDQIGGILSHWDEADIEEHPALVAELPGDEEAASPIGSLVPVRLETVLTDIGTLQLWCHDLRGEGRWKLEFELRDEQTAPADEAGSPDPRPTP